MVVVSDARNERNVLILTGIGHFATRFFELMFPTLAVSLAAQSGASLEQVLGWSFLGYLLFGLGALPAGLLADRVGSRLMLIAAIFGLGVAALAASEAPNGRALSLCLAVMGLCGSVYHPAGTSLITRTIDARGRALGVNGMFGSVAIALTPVVTAALCARLGWQDTFRAVGYVTCAIAVACAFLPIDERRTAHARAAALVTLPWARRRMMLFGVLLVAAMLAAVSYRGNTLLLPGYFAARVPEMGFGLATSLVYLLGIAGQYVGGRLADRRDLGLGRLYLIFHALSLPALLLMIVLSGVPLLGGAAIFVFFSFGMQPIESSLFAQLTPPRWRATAFGVKFACTFGVGSLAVWLVQWADVTGGLRLAMLCLAGVVALVVAVAAVFLRLSRRTPASDSPAARRRAGTDKAPLVEVGA